MRYNYQRSYLTPIWILIGTNLVLFLARLILPELLTIFGLQWYGLGQQPWTIITSMFMHLSWGHIIGNMITLFFFGTYLLQLVGLSRFLIVYFVGGLIGNLLFLVLAPHYTIAMGASGAIFALGGALAVMRPKWRVFIFPIPAPIPLWIAVLGGFLIMLLPGVAWQAHLGGLITGGIAGLYFRRWERRYRI